MTLSLNVTSTSERHLTGKNKIQFEPWKDVASTPKEWKDRNLPKGILRDIEELQLL